MFFKLRTEFDQALKAKNHNFTDDKNVERSTITDQKSVFKSS